MSESSPTDATCPYCDRRFARDDYRDLHLGVDHEDLLTDAERERYEVALAEEEEQLRLFRYKALGLLVLVYFGFLMLFAFSLA